MPGPLKIRAPLACRIARVDRDRFNEAVARGEYPNPPAAGPGRPRPFLIPDVVGLFVWGRLLERGLSPSAAGHYASEVARRAKQIEGHENDLTVCRLQTTMDIEYYISGTRALTPKRKQELEEQLGLQIISPNAIEIGGDSVLSQENWQIGNIRKIIDRAIEDYRNTLGEEEAIG